MHQLRNFVMRLSISYILVSILLLLPGISSEPKLFDVWVIAFIFTLLSVSLRRVLVTLTLPLIIMTGGLFIFVVDVALLALTAGLTRLNVTNFWWALLGVIVMSSASIWVERAFRDLGWLRDDEPGQPNVLTRRSPPWWVRLTLLAVLLFGVGFSFAMAAQLFLLAGHVTTNVLTMAISACIGFTVFAFGISWLVAQGLALARRARFSLVATFLATLLIAIPTLVTIVSAPPGEMAPPTAPRPGKAVWVLPTGSEIAYTHIPATGGPFRRNPIIFLHGLGEAVLDTDIEFFGRLSEAGYDIYLYDMVGSGLSGRLVDIEGYTISRHTDDLEAIREIINGDRLILIAHADGARIAINMMIEHRDRVERVIIYSPTALTDTSGTAIDMTRTAASPISVLTSLLEVRPWVADAMAYVNPRAAQAYVGQAEMSAWADRNIDAGEYVCFGSQEAAPNPTYPGYNPYVEILGNLSARAIGDPRPQLAKLPIPTLLVRGECDWIDPAVVRQYQMAIPYLQTTRIESAGHMPHLEKPDIVRWVILEFLDEQR